MATANSFMYGFMTKKDAQSIIESGASHIRVQVNIFTSESGDKTYQILGSGADEDQNPVGEEFILCPTPALPSPDILNSTHCIFL